MLRDRSHLHPGPAVARTPACSRSRRGPGRGSRAGAVAWSRPGPSASSAP